MIILMNRKRTISFALLASFLLLANEAIAGEVSPYLEQACVDILKSQLKRPDTIQVTSIESSSGNIYVDYKAKNPAGSTVHERALCQVPDRATVSMMTAHRREYSHLN